MGIGKWLARKGNVGGTARWAGNAYWSIKRQSPNAEVKQIMEQMVAIRYHSDSTKRERDALISVIKQGGMRGLAHLVTNILSIEADFRENTQENRFLFMDVIKEELEKLGIPEQDIYDFSRPPSSL
jgi:hypothetical protein